MFEKNIDINLKNGTLHSCGSYGQQILEKGGYIVRKRTKKILLKALELLIAGLVQILVAIIAEMIC